MRHEGGGQSKEGLFGEHEKIRDTFNPFGAEGERGRSEDKGLFDIIAEIQQMSVIERKAQNEINPEYFTLKQQIEFFKVGFKTGIVEGVFFMFAFPVLLVIIPAFMIYFYGTKFSSLTLFMLNFGGFLSITIVTLLTLNLTRYYSAGKLTRKATDALFIGRGSALIAKALISYWLFYYLYRVSVLSPKTIWEICKYSDILTVGVKTVAAVFGATDIVNQNFSQSNYFDFFYVAIVPILGKTGLDMLLSLLIAGALPFLAIGYLRIRGDRGVANQKRFEEY